MERKNTVEKKFSNLKEEFKNFAFKEATIGAAVGIMLGAALKDVITSLVNDILTPPIAYLTSGIDLSSKYFVLGTAQYDSLEIAKEANAVIIYYGNFINSLISFLITALILFLIVYQITRLASKFKKKEEKVQGDLKRKCSYCKSEIDKDAKRCPFCTSNL